MFITTFYGTTSHFYNGDLFMEMVVSPSSFSQP